MGLRVELIWQKMELGELEGRSTKFRISEQQRKKKRGEKKKARISGTRKKR